MVIDELSGQIWAQTNKANVIANGLPARVPTVTAPSGDGVVEFGGLSVPGNYSAKNLVLLPYGTGAATNTFSMNVHGWRKTGLGIGAPLWIPVKLGNYTVTLGTAPGIINSDLGTTVLFATSVTRNLSPTSPIAVAEDWFELSPGSNDIAVIVIPSLGFQALEVTFSTGASATGCNALWAKK